MAFLDISARGAKMPTHTLDKRSVLNWAKAVAADRSCVFLDTETTGIDGPVGIVDLAVIGHDGTVLINTLVNPEMPIPSGASNVHGIFDHHVRTAPTWRQVHADLAALLSGRRVVIYNAEYDTQVIQQCARRCGLPMPPATYECAMKNYAKWRGDWNDRHNDYRWHKLDIAARDMGISAGGHRALGDAEACRGVVFALARH